MEGQGQWNAPSDSLIYPDEWTGLGSPSSLISEIVRSCVGNENRRRAVEELMNQIDASLAASGLVFHRTNLENGHLINPATADGPEAPGAHSSNPILISSEEEDDDDGERSGSSNNNGRRSSLKRRAPDEEDAPPPPRQLLLGESSSSVRQREVVVAGGGNARIDALNNGANHHHVNHFVQLGAGNGIGMAAAAAPFSIHEPQNAAGRITIINQDHINGAAASLMNQASTGARQAENFQRNIRLRRNPNLHPMNSHVQSHRQTASLSPNEHFLNSRATPVQLTAAHQYVQFPETSQTQQGLLLSRGITMSSGIIRGEPSSSVNTRLEEGNLAGNNQRNIMLPGSERGNLPHIMAANMNLANNGNTNSPGNGAASSIIHDPSSSNSRISAVPIWYPDEAISYSNRLLRILRLVESQGPQPDYRPVQAVPAAPAGNMINNIRTGNMRSRLGPRRRRSMPMADADYLDITGRGRQHSVSEVQDGFSLVSGGGGGFRIRDITVMNRSVWLGIPEGVEEDDFLEEMRLDIDTMTYEELIDMSDEIGNVSTGLSEAIILGNLMVQQHVSSEPRHPDDNAPLCCVCQEEYANGEVVGNLECGHDFHANCIKKWLMQKNQCPICRKTGLADGE